MIKEASLDVVDRDSKPFSIQFTDLQYISIFEMVDNKR